MNYKEWLEQTIGNKLKEKNEKLNLKVYEQSNARYDGGIYDCTIVINGLGGTTDADVEVVPIQLMCLSGGQYEIDEEGNTAYDVFYEVLKEFCKEYNYTTNIINDFDRYKHSYIQPYPINPLEQDSGTFRINFVISGSLTITRAVDDIVKLVIEEQEVKFLTCILSYFTTLSPTNKINQTLTTNVVQNAGFKLQVQMYNRESPLVNIARSIREGHLTPNQKVNVKITYSNGYEENLGNMLIESLTWSNDKVNPSSTTIDLVKSD